MSKINVVLLKSGDGKEKVVETDNMFNELAPDFLGVGSYDVAGYYCKVHWGANESFTKYYTFFPRDIWHPHLFDIEEGNMVYFTPNDNVQKFIWSLHTRRGREEDFFEDLAEPMIYEVQTITATNRSAYVYARDTRLGRALIDAYNTNQTNLLDCLQKSGLPIDLEALAQGIRDKSKLVLDRLSEIPDEYNPRLPDQLSKIPDEYNPRLPIDLLTKVDEKYVQYAGPKSMEKLTQIVGEALDDFAQKYPWLNKEHVMKELGLRGE